MKYELNYDYMFAVYRLYITIKFKYKFEQNKMSSIGKFCYNFKKLIITRYRIIKEKYQGVNNCGYSLKRFVIGRWHSN